MKPIEKIYKETRLDFFCMALSYVMDKGYSYIEQLTDEDVGEMYQELVKKDEEEGGISILTPGFQRDLVSKAREIVNTTEFTDLLGWIGWVNPIFDWRDDNQNDYTSVGFIGEYGREDETQFDTTNKRELADLWWEFCLENGIITYTEEGEYE